MTRAKGPIPEPPKTNTRAYVDGARHHALVAYMVLRNRSKHKIMPMCGR